MSLEKEVISDKEQLIIDALHRILNGNPINIDKKRKLSASAVEDEARVSRSLSRHYPDTFAKIQEAILLSKSKKLKDDTGIIRKPKNDKNLKEEINKLKEDKISLQEKCDKLIAANIGLAQRIRYLESKIQ